jgi:hypothetical protein
MTTVSDQVNPVLAIFAYINVLIVKIKNRISGLLISLPNVVSRRTKTHKFPFMVAALCFITSYPIGATEAIMIVTREYVVIGADSLFIGGTTRSGCKIEQSDGIFWVAAGLYDNRNTGFNVGKFISAARKNHPHPREMLDELGTRIIPSLQRELKAVKTGYPWFYQRILNSGVILTVMAAIPTGIGVEAYAKEFRIADNKITTLPAQTCSQIDGCILHAGAPAVGQYLKSKSVWGLDSLKAMDTLMSVALHDDRDAIGAPFSVLRISPNDTHWLRQNNCADIQKPTEHTKRSPKKSKR